MVSSLLGGIGLFLLGMVLLTDGLKSAAGDALRRLLSRFVAGRFSALFSGIVVTVLVQSSSATTLATIGFVSAGLLTFSQSVGVIFGANLGTTTTGWIVSLLGLKFSMSQVALPLVGVGALLRLLGRGRAVPLGMALAGFGLIFVGIDMLQAGMGSFAERVDLSRFAADSVLGRLMLVGVGLVMTVVMQSSSAAVATTLAALHGGALTLEQAGAMVIGQNVGTTATAALAVVGASVPAKRTAVAHILFNGLTAIVAFFALPALLRLLSGLVPAGEGHDATTIAAFHTTFSLLGVAMFLPFIEQFSRGVERLVPQRGSALTRHLDKTVADVPEVAVDAVARTVREVTREVVIASRAALADKAARSGLSRTLDASEAALGQTRRFLARVSAQGEHGAVQQAHVAVLQAMEHLGQLLDELRDPEHWRPVQEDGELVKAVEALQRGLAGAGEFLGKSPAPLPPELGGFSAGLETLRREERLRLLGRTARGELSPERVGHALEALRWLDRVGHHAARACVYLSEGAPEGEARAA